MRTRGSLLAYAMFSMASLVASCGGGSNGGGTPLAPAPSPPPAPPPAAVTLPPLVADAPEVISGPTPFASNCTGGPTGGTVYANAEVEPYVAINPRESGNWLIAWQQDRWSNGAANGVMTATTLDGDTWRLAAVPFSRCAGGNAANGGDYERATDPWVTFSPDGTAFVMALGITGTSFTAGSRSAMLVSRSTDGGRTWGPVSTLIRDGEQFFNDKNSITADPTDPRYVYAVWDRLAASGGGPTILARSTDGGQTWEAARAIHDPGSRSQTIGNVIAVLPNGTVVNLFTQLDSGANGQARASLNVLLSSDKGGSWTGPFKVADALPVGASDPETGTPIRDGSTLGQIAVAPNGHLWIAWQDARFSGGERDGIALSRSTDGGQTWSPPVQVNSAPSAQAFTPSVHVTANGTIGVTYYDLRSNTSDTTTLPADLILARSLNGATWAEHRVSPTFDLASAPVSRGFFLGDYQGLASASNVFVPVYVRTNSGNTANRTDVFAVPTRSLSALASIDGAARALSAPTVRGEASPDFTQRVHENIVRAMERRVPGWSNRFANPPR
jgi:hypothetical protein